MNIYVAEKSGFCFGVKKAIDIAKENVQEGKIFTFGPLIHNNQVIEKLKDMGIEPIDSLDKVKNGKVIIRSHGIPLSTYEEAQSFNIEIIDATCPYVRKVQKLAEKYHSEGYQIVILGDKNHPEIIGINGWCDNSAIIIPNHEDLDKIRGLESLCIICQTTFSHKEYDIIVKELNLDNSLVFNTICSATSERQEACLELAKNVDIMFVIGGKHSSNTKKLYSICLEECPCTYHIETKEDLYKIDFKNCSNSEKIGVTAGASTPDWIIYEVIDKLENEGEVIINGKL
jgi:4-hydroxy-3-methylbut-2-enyl diphosphate reductase